MGGHFESEYTILLRSSRRVGKKTFKVTHANLSRLSSELVDQIEILVKGGSAVKQFEDAFEVVASKRHGHVAAVLGTISKLGLPFPQVAA